MNAVAADSANSNQAPTKAEASQKAKVALYLDLENLHACQGDNLYGRGWYRAHMSSDRQPLLFDISALLSLAETHGQVTVRKAYCDFRRFAAYKAELERLGVKAVEIGDRQYGTKNSADLIMATDLIEHSILLGNPAVIFICSGDADFIAPAQLARRYHHRVVGVGVRNYASIWYLNSLNQFISLEQIPPTVPKTKDSLESLKRTIRAALGICEQHRPGQPIPASVLKNVILRDIDSSFSEKQFGFGSFSRLLRSLCESLCIDVVQDPKFGSLVISSPTLEAR